jgi:hypothetical protein
VWRGNASPAEHHVPPTFAGMSNVQIAVRDADAISDITMLAVQNLLPETVRPSRRDPRIGHLLAIGQRLKRERDQAIREREINSAVLELWLTVLWRLHRYGPSDS